MNIIAIIEHVRAQRWRKEQLALDIVAGLVARGNNVTVVCDAIEDTSALGQCASLSGGSLSIEMRRPDRKRNDGRSRAFAWWARKRVGQIGRDAEVSGNGTPVALSLTPVVCGQIWLPVARDPRGAMGRVVASPNPLSMAMEVARERSEVVSSIACAHAARSYRAGHVVHALPVGAAQRTLCTRLRIGNDIDGIAGVGFLSPLSSRFDRDALARARASARTQLRSMLLLPHGASLVAMSLNSHDLDAIDAVFAGLAMIEPSQRPTFVIAGSMAGSIDALACKHTVASHVRLIGPTHRMDLVLLGSDAALHPGSTRALRAPLGRFLADAVYCETPMIAGPNAPGRSLAIVNGTLVEAHDPALWAGALHATITRRVPANTSQTSVGVTQVVTAIELHCARALRASIANGGN